MEGLNNISIAKLKELNFSDAYAYEELLIVSDEINHLDIFRSPCRVNGVVMFLCTGGEIDCTINLKPYHLSTGTLLMNFTSDIITVTQTKDFKGYAALVANDYLQTLKIDFYKRFSFYLGVRNNAITKLTESDAEAIEMFFKLLKKNTLDKRPESGEILNRLIQAIAMTIVSVTMAASKEEDTLNMEAPKQIRGEQTFEKFMTLLSQCHAREREVKYFADALGLTSNYLSNLIRKYSGKSAFDWINEFAISEAQVLLRFSDLTIQEIAYQLNFPSQSAFGKFYKKYAGLSPKAYRQSNSE